MYAQCAVILLFVIFIYLLELHPSPRWQLKPKSESQPVGGVSQSNPNIPLRPMAEIGKEIGSDKVLVHRYHVPYELHLAPLRNKSVKFLEIGLGCLGLRDVGLGVRLWGEYFPHGLMDVVEKDADCGRRFEERNKNQRWGPSRGVVLHYGDQSDPDFLDAVGKDRGGWDLIVDDGSHEPEHQIASFKRLFPHLNTGGKYAIEDVQTSFWNGKWGGSGTATHWIGTELIRRVHTRISRKNGREELDSKFRSEVASVDCHHFVCIITKR